MSNDTCLPDQVHIALGDAFYNTTKSNITTLITWQTRGVCGTNYISLNSSDGTKQMTIYSNSTWQDMINQTVSAKNEGVPNATGGSYISYSYTAALALVPGTTYIYKILETTGNNTAGPYNFTVPLLNFTKNVKVAIYADIDTSYNNATLNYINNQSANSSSFIDAQICLGDIGYDLYSENGTRGEYFFNKAQSSIATMPFMVTPGNHEYYGNYTFLNFRAKMPQYNMSQNQYYSFNLGQIHFIGINLYNYDDSVNITGAQAQIMNWLTQDLQNAVANRAACPWIVVYSHRPIYCSFNNMSTSVQDSDRCYSLYSQYEQFDELYHQYNVDLVLQAHVHYWERMGPIYKNASVPYASWFTNSSANNTFLNPGAPIYTIEGAAGNNYFMVTQATTPASYSINIDSTLAFSRLSTVNSTALYYEHIASTNGSTLDYFYLLKGSQYPTYAASSSSSKVWLVALIIVVVVAFIGALVYYNYRKSQVTELEKSINQDNRDIEISKVRV